MKKHNFKGIVMGVSAGVMALATVFFAGVSPVRGSAASISSIVYEYDNTAIEQDLEDVDILQYPQDLRGRPQVIRFQEYCYSEKPFYAEAYGLYFYVYNPSEKEVRKDGNKANMAVAYDENGEPTDYQNVELTFLDSTDNGRFLKFKVKDDVSFLQRVKEYAAKHNGQRRYDVGGVQLYYKNGDIGRDASVSKTYRWTGFAAGMGNGNEDTSSLTCAPLETLQLEVHPTYFRASAAGEHVISQDSLHSVYFSVPNKYLREYGDVYEIEAEYLGAMLKPMLCTGNEAAYEALLPYLGQDLSTHNEGLNLMYAADVQKLDIQGYDHSAEYVLNYEETDNFVLVKDFNFEIEIRPDRNKITPLHQDELSALYLMFATDSWAENSADSYIVPSSEIKEAMIASANDYGNVINGAEHSYSRNVFSSIDENYTNVIQTTDDKLTLSATTLQQTKWWEKLFNVGGSEQTEELFKGLQAVYQVTGKDITGNPTSDCKKLCIAESDYNDFCETYYEAQENDETVFLFRYRISQYETYEATLFAEVKSLIGDYEYWRKVDTNAYFFTQAVDLDFDIIDVTFMDEDGATVLSVVSDPLDFVPDGTPPEDPDEDDGGFLEDGLPTWAWVLIIMAALALLIFVKPVLTFVIMAAKGAIELIKLPFKGIAWLVEKFSGDNKGGGRKKK